MKRTLGWMSILLLTAACSNESFDESDLTGAWRGHDVEIVTSDPSLVSIFKKQYSLHKSSVLNFSENKTYSFQEMTTHTSTDGKWYVNDQKLLITNFGDTVAYQIVKLTEDSLITSSTVHFDKAANGEKLEVEILQTYAKAD
ncbi:lipocalin-like domain-containing protein [Phaeocystidibacter luteus]|uniref:Lipocalin family protein n=1 Tax=Phaeocystidibacter luteus TaxID=911197 RepID=A0A6N6RJB6_9FLAO|nr:lipocalin family protein [Phaeocystidibacter luteus]KAB2813708.1 lipocalin family protein [Phaeocystidibacter luteus]